MGKNQILVIITINLVFSITAVFFLLRRFEQSNQQIEYNTIPSIVVENKTSDKKSSTKQKHYTSNGREYSCRLAMGTIVRNEGLYIVEWIEFHLRMGVERFYIADHDSTDNTKELLKPYMSSGVVRLIHFNHHQTKTYNMILGKARRQRAEWLCFLDVDCFVYTRSINETIPSILNTFNSSVGSVGISYLEFDHNGHMNRTNNQSLLERFTHRRRPDHAIKGAYSRSISIHRPLWVKEVNMHHPVELTDGKLFVDIEGIPLRPGQSYLHGQNVVAPHNGTIRINHYYCKSRQEFEWKNQRNSAWASKLSTWDDRCQDSWEKGVYDTDILKHVKHELSNATLTP